MEETDHKRAKKMNNLSREMTKLLRHTGSSKGLDIGEDGYANLTELLQVCRKTRGLKPTLDDIKEIVNTNDKKRM
jgi:2'-phosphotransferase